MTDWVGPLIGAAVGWALKTATDAWRARRRKAASTRREANNARIVQLLKLRTGTGPGGSMHRDAIGRELELNPSELQPLLDELTAAHAIFRSAPPMPPDYYSLSDWRPDGRRLFGGC